MKFRTKLYVKLYTKLYTKFYIRLCAKLCAKLYTKLCVRRLYTKLCVKLYISGPCYIPDSLYMCLCQVYPLCSYLISYPSFLTSSLSREAPERQLEDRCQN